MKRVLALLVLSSSFAAAGCEAKAQTISPWGFPLGATADQLRKAEGPPTVVRQVQSHMPVVPMMETPKPANDESWEYDRNGIRFWILLSDGRTRTVEASAPMVADLSSEPAPAPADPIGLKIGDSLGAILVKTGAVKKIEPNNGLQVETATISVSRGNLRYQFQLMNGRINTEWVTLVTR